MGKQSKRGKNRNGQHVHHKTGEGTHQHHKYHDGSYYKSRHKHDHDQEANEVDQKIDNEVIAPTPFVAPAPHAEKIPFDGENEDAPEKQQQVQNFFAGEPEAESFETPGISKEETEEQEHLEEDEGYEVVVQTEPSAHEYKDTVEARVFTHVVPPKGESDNSQAAMPHPEQIEKQGDDQPYFTSQDQNNDDKTASSEEKPIGDDVVPPKGESDNSQAAMPHPEQIEKQGDDQPYFTLQDQNNDDKTASSKEKPIVDDAGFASDVLSQKNNDRSINIETRENDTVVQQKNGFIVDDESPTAFTKEGSDPRSSRRLGGKRLTQLRRRFLDKAGQKSGALERNSSALYPTKKGSDGRPSYLKTCDSTDIAASLYQDSDSSL
eukprot:CAMPEP_0198154976 /NCGR_PEP_ID=MMETSP1443-20131203/68890_1 /TAXON_ID=186043 /ORGANISM="Entomoneis sp., Strain CCMP2396" /LENGTH=377 /DNA_ID=CAMNT_0043821695 /DNA_START=87 /DNA_END=1221 /DNA_ORIENTATION=+